MFGNRNGESMQVPLYQVYGRAGTSMNSAGFQNKFGKSNSKIGQRGEAVLMHKLRDRNNGWLPAEIPLFCSLIVPGKSSDIDFAMVNGNKILLVDAKMYRQDGGWYWNFGDSPVMRRNFSKYRSKSGNQVKLSKSMIMAKDILSQKLPGYQVEAIVVFTTDPRNPRATAPNTTFLTYPGGVKAYNDAGARKFINRFFRGTRRTPETLKAEHFLKSITQ